MIMLRLHFMLMLVTVLIASLLAGLPFLFALEDSNIRLINGSDSCSGRVEVRHNGQWGTVCDDNWDIKEAAVVCRQAGCGGAVGAFSGAFFGAGSDPILLDEVYCTGNETAITECLHDEFGVHNCERDEDAGVVCSGRYEVRLVNGTESCCGRVEIQHKDRWGTVCDRSWDLRDAEVVCRQLGCGRAVSAPRGAQFGRGSGPTWLDEVQCTGNESFINECSHRGFGKENCGHDEDAGIVCLNLQSPELSQISINTVVSPGESVQFRCTTPNHTCIPVDFRLYKSGTVIMKQTSESTTSFSFTVDASHQGQYSCDYTYGKLGSITSPRSNSISITVASLVLYIAFGVTAGLLLFLIPVIVCCIKTRKCKQTGKDDEQYANTAFKRPKEVSEMGSEHEYENAETFFHQDLNHSQNKYIYVDADVQRTEMHSDHKDKQVYANCD